MPEGHPWLKPIRFHRSYRRATTPGAAAEASRRHRRHRLLPRRGRGGPRGGRRPGPRRRHRAGPLPLPVPRRARSSTWRSRSATSTAASSGRCVGGPDKRTIHMMETLAGDTHDRPRHGLLPGGRSALAGARCPPAPRRCAASPWSWSGWPTTSATSGRWPATSAFLPDRVLLRAHPRRLPQPDRPALRQPLRPRPGPARRRRLRPGRATGVGELLAAPGRGAAATWRSAVELLWDTPSVQARFEDTGVVAASQCRGSSGLVGPAARACGPRARRAPRLPLRHLPLRPHPGLDLARPATSSPGPTCAGSRSSARPAFIREQLGALPGRRPRRAAVGAPGGRTRLAVALSRAGAARSATSPSPTPRAASPRYKVVDPSFHNWFGLAMALRDQQISDFPLCNKSFNLSYCGHDL